MGQRREVRRALDRGHLLAPRPGERQRRRLRVISAGGPHATTLHWIENDGPIVPGQLVLLDMGVENRSLYTADVTRTLPIAGTFTDEQRHLYDLVFAAQEAGMAAVQPGAAYKEFHLAAMGVLAKGLEEMGILPSRPTRPWTRTAASTAAGRCTARATCSASTSTTARPPGARTTTTASSSPAWC